MSIIGTFTKTEAGYRGTIKTLTLNLKVTFVTNTTDGERQPDYRVFAGTTQIGAAWKKTVGTSGRDYLSVSLDDPSFSAPIYAMLFDSEDGDGSANLVWTRPSTS